MASRSDDLTQATGSFTFDASNGSISNWSIVTSPGSGSNSSIAGPTPMLGNIYSPSPLSGAALVTPGLVLSFFNMATGSLQLQIARPLTGSGGIISIVQFARYGTSNSMEYSGLSNATRLVSSGSLVAAVPEPSTYALMLAGLAVVGFVARTRRQNEPA